MLGEVRSLSSSVGAPHLARSHTGEVTLSNNFQSLEIGTVGLHFIFR